MLDDVLRHRAPGSDPGIEIAVLECPGSGPPALLHHANGFCGALWAPVAEQLARDFRVFAVDARGHGDSSKPEGDEAYAWSKLANDLGSVADFVLERCGATSVALGVGHSFGGTLTMTAASQRRGRYERAILIDPVFLPPPGSPERWPTGENPMVDRARRRRHAWNDRAEARAFFAGKPLFAHWTKRALDLYVDEGLDDAASGVELKCPGRVEAAIFGGGGDFDAYSAAEKAELPVRLVRATDGDFRREAYERVLERLPEGELTDLEGGHLVVMERPDAVVAEIREFAGVA